MEFSPDKSIDILGMGSALMDIQIPLNEADFSRFNFPKGSMNLISPVKREEILKTLEDKKKIQSSGGSAANTLFAVTKLGGQSAMFGCVAQDDIGRDYIQEMKSVGVNFLSNPTTTRDEQSGTCIILITPDAERTLITTLGCAPLIAESQIQPGIIAKSKILYIEGYLWDKSETISVVKKAIAIAKESDTLVAFSSSDAFCVDRHREDFLNLLPNETDIYFANADEAKSLCAKSMDDKMDLSESIEKLKMLKKRGVLIITDGKEGSYIIKEGEIQTHIKAVQTKAVDTTGAGDAYAAGILYGLSTGMSFLEMGNLGSDIASQVVSKFGARF